MELVKCVCCGTVLNRLYPEHKDSPPDVDVWDGAVVDRISGGFGSEYDRYSMIIGICDACVKEKTSSGTLLIDHDPLDE